MPTRSLVREAPSSLLDLMNDSSPPASRLVSESVLAPNALPSRTARSQHASTLSSRPRRTCPLIRVAEEHRLGLVIDSVLIVSADAAFADRFHDELSPTFASTRAGSLREALERLDLTRPQAIVLDTPLADATGLKAYFFISQHTQEACVLALTRERDHLQARCLVTAGAAAVRSRESVFSTDVRIVVRDAIATAARRRSLAGNATIAAQAERVSMCAVCRKTRDHETYWNRLEALATDDGRQPVSAAICPACARQLYGH